jgi:hypothetical protein
MHRTAYPALSSSGTSRPPMYAGSAFTYRYLTRQPTTPAEQAKHPEPAQHRR